MTYPAYFSACSCEGRAAFFFPCAWGCWCSYRQIVCAEATGRKQSSSLQVSLQTRSVSNPLSTTYPRRTATSYISYIQGTPWQFTRLAYTVPSTVQPIKCHLSNHLSRICLHFLPMLNNSFRPRIIYMELRSVVVKCLVSQKFMITTLH